MQSERLRVVYELSPQTAAEPLERAAAEACRRHRAPPRDVVARVVPPTDEVEPAIFTVSTSIPVSRDGRARAALLRDIETILEQRAPDAWRRLTCEIEAPQQSPAGP